MHDLLFDIRYAARALLHQRVFTVVVVLLLGIGIGANATVFSFVKAVLLQSLPVADSSSLVAVFTTDEKNPGYLQSSYPNYRDYRQQAADVFSDILAFKLVGAHLVAGERPEVAVGYLATGNYFEILGIEPALGRFFLPAEDQVPGGHPVLVLSHDFWRSRFGTDPGVVGRRIRLNGLEFEVIGVAPSGFHGTDIAFRPVFWVPAMMYERVLSATEAELFENRRALLFNVVGRLRPGVSLSEARSAVGVIGPRLEAAYPEENDGRAAALVPLLEATVHPALRGGVMRVAALLTAVTLAVLAIACVNVVGLLVARTAARGREIAVRLSMGAGRARLVRQLLVESLLLALAGGVLGLLLAAWIPRVLWSLLPELPVPVALDLQIDLRVILFVLALSLGSGLILGLALALPASRAEQLAVLRDKAGVMPGRSGSRPWSRRLLVVAQVALSLLCLVAAGLFVRSLRETQRVDPGFDADRLMAITLSLDAQGYEEEAARSFFDRMLTQVRSLPGVTSAALATHPPLGGGMNRSVFRIGEESSADGTLVPTNSVSPGYFETLGLTLVRGRGFDDFDGPEAQRVAVVNEAMAESFWPGRDATGQRLRLYGIDAPYEVVGIAHNSKYMTLGEAPHPYLYLAVAQNYPDAVVLNVRVAGSPAAALENVRRTVQALDPDLPLIESTTVTALLDRSLWGSRMGASVVGAFGLLALTLAAVGIYGLMAYSLALRRGEIGLRMALGADRRKVIGLVLRQGMLLVVVGVVLGIGLGLAASSLLANLLYGVGAVDLAVFGASALLLAVVAGIALYIPARRAATSEPATVLRGE